MQRKTVAQAIEATEKEIGEKNRKLMAELAILRTLPSEHAAPLVVLYGRSSIAAGALLYEEEELETALENLEAAGWQPVCASLVKWDNYAPCTMPGSVEDIDENPPAADNFHRELKTIEPIAPLWIETSVGEGYSRASVNCFYRSPAGEVFEIKIRVKTYKIRADARRIEYPGGWRYEGSARLVIPEKWRAGIIDPTGRAIGEAAPQCCARVSTERSLDTRTYFTPYDSQTDSPTASKWLRILRPDF